MPNSPLARQRHGPNASSSPTVARTIAADGGSAADLAIGSQMAPEMLADDLVRHMFALSMDLHRILGRISTPADRTGRPKPVNATPTAHPADHRSVHLHPDSEQLRRILHEAIAELDQMVHQTRVLVFAHLDSTTRRNRAPFEHPPSSPGQVAGTEDSA
jgi:hypothetical protein